MRGPDKKHGKSGAEHGLYVHGLGKSRPYDPKKYAAWKKGVLRFGGLFFCVFLRSKK